MKQPLSASHFKARTRETVSAIPSAVKLSALLAEACRRTFVHFVAISWRVTPDRIEESGTGPADSSVRSIRFESASGSLTTDIALDRPLISALLEAFMGGSGMESPFDLGERPLSAIENGLLDLVCERLASEVAQTMSSHFGRPFSHFRDREARNPNPADNERASFRLLVNVFGHSGEVLMSMDNSELIHQIRSSDPVGENAEEDAACNRLQRQVGRSDVELTVTLGPETLSVEDITTLLPGRMITLSSTVSTPVTLWSGGIAAFEGSLARSGDRLAVTIAAAIV